MSKKLPLKWFPDEFTARPIRLQKVDKWAEYHAKSGLRPYFDTWEEAYEWMLNKATKNLARAKKELSSAERFLNKVRVFTKPDNEQLL